MLFDVDQLTFRYEGNAALNNLSLSIPEASRVALLGANGSGKSTLLRVLDGLHFGASGVARFRGEDLSEEHFADDQWAFAFRRQVGLVFQNPDAQLFNPTVFDEVAFSPLQMRWSKADIKERVMETLDFLQIGHLKDRPPQRLSGGEKKRVALASVLVLDPAHDQRAHAPIANRKRFLHRVICRLQIPQSQRAGPVYRTGGAVCIR